MKAENTNR